MIFALCLPCVRELGVWVHGAQAFSRMFAFSLQDNLDACDRCILQPKWQRKRGSWCCYIPHEFIPYVALELFIREDTIHTGEAELQGMPYTPTQPDMRLLCTSCILEHIVPFNEAVIDPEECRKRWKKRAEEIGVSLPDIACAYCTISTSATNVVLVHNGRMPFRVRLTCQENEQRTRQAIEDGTLPGMLAS